MEGFGPRFHGSVGLQGVGGGKPLNPKPLNPQPKAPNPKPLINP